MRRRIFLILIILVTFTGCGIFCLNKFVLPVKIKSLLIAALQDKTHKKISLKALRFSIFRGLVLKDLIIYDTDKPLLTIKESSCSFFLPSILFRKLVITNLTFKSPAVYLERRKDNTFNLQDLFLNADSSKSPNQLKPAIGERKGAGFEILIYRINIRSGSINFRDNTLPEQFTKNMENLEMNIYLSLPAKIKFNLKTEMSGVRASAITASGEFLPAQNYLTARISLQNISPKEFLPYYKDYGLDIGKGQISAIVDLVFKDESLSARASIMAEDLNIKKGSIFGVINSDLKTSIQYSLKDKSITFSGSSLISNSRILSIKTFGAIEGISASFTFDNSGVFSDKLSAKIWDTPVEAKLSLQDFGNPFFALEIASSLDLASLKSLLRDRLKISFPVDANGGGKVFFALKGNLPIADNLQLNGYLDVNNARLKFKEPDVTFENIAGRIAFDRKQLNCKDLILRYRGIAYKISAMLKDFTNPSVTLEVISDNLSVVSDFSFGNKFIKIARLSGRYFNSEFSLTGAVNIQDASKAETNVSGTLDMDLRDIYAPLNKLKDQLDLIRPQGLIHAQLRLSGNAVDFKSCAIEAEFSSPAVSVYGLKSGEFSLDYNQSGGVINISPLRLSFYDGSIQALASMNLNSANLPYWVSVDMAGVKLDKLKLDTSIKDKDLSGSLSTRLKLNGFGADVSKLSGGGDILVTEGKLGQLNLFQGLGSFLFVKDFSSIVFSEASCNFLVKDKDIFTDNLRLKSNITNLSGPVRIGFDGRLAASLDVEVLDQFVPLSGTIKDVTTAIIGKAGKFGVIKISGTLKEPKYKFKPAAVNIFKGLKDAVFGN